MSPEIRAAISRWEPEWQAEFTERAGILEFDGGLTRAVAEQRAYRMIHQRREACRRSMTRS